jgi:hypothetical protein
MKTDLIVLTDWRKASTKKIIEPVTGLRTALEGILFDQEDFDLIRPHKWRLTQDGYLLTSDPANRQTGIYMHRLIMNPPDDMEIDHIDGNKLDNRKINLRIATKRDNRCNVRPRDNKKYSKFKGVCKNGNRWTAMTKINGKVTCVGRFDTEEEAALAYNEAAKKHQGDFAWLNQI